MKHEKVFPVCYAISPIPVLLEKPNVAKVEIQKMKIEARNMKKRIRAIENAIKRLETAIKYERQIMAKAWKGGET